jgi:inner membrane protease subunit 1
MKDHYAGHPWRLASAMIRVIFIAHVTVEYGISLSPTEGASMLPTFEVVGDWVLSSKRFRRGKGIQVGDIIQFDSVAKPGESVIKRVIGLEGDYVLRDTPGTKSDSMIQVCEVLSMFLNLVY